MSDRRNAEAGASFAQVRALGLVSLLTDASSEAVYPVLPLFLTNVIGAPVAAIGLIESLAEATAAIAKVFSGRLSDRVGKRRPLVLIGYSLSNLVKPALALVPSWPWALALRVTDRLGKGVRTAPRDALIADYAPEAKRGEAFGLHRAMDTIGAAIGPLIAWAILALEPEGYRTVFLVSAVPGMLAILVALTMVRDRARQRAVEPDAATVSFHGLGRKFAAFAAISMVFALGNSSDAMLILRAQDLGAAPATVPLMYFVFNVVAASLARLFGRRSDRVGRRRVLVAGFAGYALVYAGFALARHAWAPWPLFFAYGVPYALTEGMARAFVVDLVPDEVRATAIGAYTFLLGLATLLSSTVAGILWDTVSHAAPFAFSAVLMAGSAAALARTRMLRAPGV
ncbi:MFS transporter [Coriobacteriia bacterium Es71-Z0120]|uniref:MFS transporter n=1 Tax=Parvivirga hydrogeniphila TaxID=2939460 RepID=UPI002260D4BC|nr:MFS transporter [Parvivirga hydrogeniphila]MCL4078863.1 MFS transporter [Parvivirga hydrogeniphila]